MTAPPLPPLSEKAASALQLAAWELLAALDAHEDAVDPIHLEAYHDDHADRIWAAKAAVRDLLCPAGA